MAIRSIRRPTGTTADTVILEGSDVKKVEAQMIQDPTTGATEYEVGLELSDEGAQKFAEATERLQGQIMFHLDGRRDDFVSDRQCRDFGW